MTNVERNKCFEKRFDCFKKQKKMNEAINHN